MKRWARWTLGATGTLVILAACAVAAGQIVATQKLQRRLDIVVAPVAIPETLTAIERGRYLYASRGCADCHAADGGGRRFIDEGSFRVAGPHIAPGVGSVTAAYTSQDWVRTVRHGVKPDGRPALIMPSEDYNRLTDADLGALVAYVRQLPAVAGDPAELKLPLPVRLLYAVGLVQDAAEKIDHGLPPQQPVEDGPTPEHGRYVAGMCQGCHGSGLSGGRIPGAPPDWPAAANLTPGSGSVMGPYADERAFVQMMKSGRRPDGSRIAVMPFGSLSQMNDADLQGLHAYLRTLPPRPTGER